MSKYQSFIKAALVICDVMIEDCRSTIAEMKPTAWWRRQAEDCFRCLESQIAVLHKPHDDATTLAALDCCVILAEAITDHEGGNASVIIAVSLAKAYEMLSDEINAKTRAARARKKKHHAELAA